MVAVQQVLAASALDPVVPAVAEDGVRAQTADDEVVTGPGEGFVVARTAVEEVLPVTAEDQVIAGTAVDGIVPRPTLEQVRPVRIRDDVVSVATEDDVVTGAAVDDVVTQAAPHGVVVAAAVHPVVAGRAVVDGLEVDAGRVDVVGREVLDRAIRLALQQFRLVARGRRVVGHGGAVCGETRRGAVQRGELEFTVGGGERVGLERMGARRGALDHFAERIALQLREQVQARGPGQVVQPITVLQIFELILEHIVEGAAQQPAEQARLLGEATDPQVDGVQAGGGDAAGRAGPCSGAEHEVRRIRRRLVPHHGWDSCRVGGYRAHDGPGRCAFRGDRGDVVRAAEHAVRSGIPDGRMGAVGGHEVDQRFRVLEVLPQV